MLASETPSVISISGTVNPDIKSTVLANQGGSEVSVSSSAMAMAMAYTVGVFTSVLSGLPWLLSAAPKVN